MARKELDDVDALLEALHEAMVEILKPVRARARRSIPRIKPFVILVVGINGAGKTTTIGKLAHRLLAEGKSVMLAAGDTFRAAAREQLEVWAERNRVPIIAQQAGRGARGRDLRRPAGGARAQHRRADRRYRGAAAYPDPLDGRAEEGQARARALGSRRAARGAAGARRHHRPERRGAGGGIPQGARASPAWSSPSSTAPPRAAWCSPSRRSLKIPIRFIGVGEQTEDFGVFNASEFVSALLKSEPPDERARRMIRFDQVYKRYPNGREALAGVSFQHRAPASSRF